MGDHFGDVSRSYAIGNVSGQDYVGVLTGTQGTDQINDSFALGTVRGNDYVGGLTGLFRPAIRSREVGRRDYEWRCSDGTYSNLDHQVGDGQPCPPTHLDSARLGHRPDRLRDRARGDTGYPHLREAMPLAGRWPEPPAEGESDPVASLGPRSAAIADASGAYAQTRSLGNHPQSLSRLGQALPRRATQTGPINDPELDARLALEVFDDQ